MQYQHNQHIVDDTVNTLEKPQIIRKLQNPSNVETPISQDTTQNSEDHIIDLDGTKQEEFPGVYSKHHHDTLKASKMTPGNLLSESYIEYDHEMGNLKDDSPDEFASNIHDYLDPNEETKKSKANETNCHEVYLIRNKDTGEIYDIRQTDTESVITPTNEVKLKIKPWIKKGKKIRNSNEKLWDAAELGDLEQVKLLLDERKQIYPAQINSRLIDDWTALHLASNEGHYEICQYLISKKANIEALTSIRRTPLHISCIRGKYTIVRLLIECGANVNAIDKDFNTPLHYASERGHADILEYLIEHKSDYTIKNHCRYTALDLASDTRIREIFKAHGIYNDKANNHEGNIFERRLIDDVIMYTNRSDMIMKLLYTVNKPIKIDKKNKRIVTVQPKIKKRGETKIYGRMTRVKIFNFGNNLKSSNKLDSENDLEERVGPHSFNSITLLGKGSFGKVYLVEKISNKKLYAMKVLRKDLIVKKNLTRYAKTERNVLSIMDHPFIVKLNYAFQTDTNLYLILDFCPGGDLGNFITKKKKLNEDLARIYAAEIILGLEALHSNDIVYRDLKPDNVVIDAEGHALLTDFGLSKEGVNTNISGSFCGSVAYLAPEILKRAGHNRTVDWYLLGVLIYEMITGIPPYFDSNPEKMFFNIQKADLKLPKGISPELEDLLTELLRRDPEKRLGAKNDSREIKSHPWFKNLHWHDVYNRKLCPPPPEISEMKMSQDFKKIEDIIANVDVSKDHVPDWTFIMTEEEFA